MATAYELHLWQLISRFPAAFLCTAFDREVDFDDAESKAAGKIRLWSLMLCKAISPEQKIIVQEDGSLIADPEDTTFPRYTPVSVVGLGGDALVIRVKDKQRFTDVVVRFKRKNEPPPGEETGAKWVPIKDPPRLIKNPGDYVKMQFNRQFEKLKASPTKKPKGKEETEDGLRFIRAYQVEKQLHNLIMKEKLTENGYIPDVYDFFEEPCSYGGEPNMWHTMEFIDGRSLLDWCQGASGHSILTLFLRMVRFVEDVFHKRWFIHSDIKPGNILVRDERPVFLDFGCAKSLRGGLDVTGENSQVGTALFSSPDDLMNSKKRGFSSDIHQLVHTFWCMWHRAQPDTSGIVQTRDVNGKIVVDFEAIAALYTTKGMPLACRYFFEKGRDCDYKDIEYLRRDVEAALEEMTPKISSVKEACEGPCQPLLETRRHLKAIGDAVNTILGIKPTEENENE